MTPARRFPFGKTPPPLPAAQVRPALQAQPAAHVDEITEPLPEPAAPVSPAWQARPTLPLVAAALPARPVLPFRPVAAVPETPVEPADLPAWPDLAEVHASRRSRAAIWLTLAIGALAAHVAVLGALVTLRRSMDAPEASPPSTPTAEASGVKATEASAPTVVPAPVVSTPPALPGAGATAVASAPRATAPRAPRPSMAARTARPVSTSDVRDPWGF